MNAHAPTGAVSILVLLAACGPKLAREDVERERFGIRLMKPQVVEASAPVVPRWTQGVDRSAVAEVAFVGEAAAPSLEDAKDRATRDLLSSISNFISVDVSSSESDEMSEAGQSVASTVKSASKASLKNFQPDSFYWERVAASPLTKESAPYRYYVHAAVAKAEIHRARVERLSSRKEKELTTVVVLPFRSVGPGDLTADGITEDLVRLLSARGPLHVVEPAIVRALVQDADDSEVEALEKVDGLLPDFVLSGLVDRRGARLDVSLIAYDAHTGRALAGKTLSRPYAELVLLERDLARVALGAVRVFENAAAKDTPKAAEAKAVEAFEAYHEAHQLFTRGELDKALEKIGRARTLSPKDPLPLLRMGHILERLGRYARIAQTAAKAAENAPRLRWCSEAGPSIEESARRALAARAQASNERGEPAPEPEWMKDALSADDVLLDALQTIEGAFSSLRLNNVPVSAAEAYLEAMRLAEAQGDERAWLESILALADLAARVDRLDAAFDLYSVVEVRSKSVPDPDHFRSLARFGQGKVRRKQGLLPEAEALLVEALGARARLGEKPYLLEIYNQLGAVHFALSNWWGAIHDFRIARQIAEELDNDYLRTVLSNNIAVLELARGDAAGAEEAFHRALEFLTNVREAEGSVSAGLNVAGIDALHGDRESAELRFSEIERILESTKQEGRRADLALSRGVFDVEHDREEAGLDPLVTSYLLELGLGRTSESDRVRRSAFAAEYYAKDLDRRRLFGCMVERYFEERAPVFQPPFALNRAPVRELVLALNAASVLPLASFRPPFPVRVTYETPKAERPTCPVYQEADEEPKVIIPAQELERAHRDLWEMRASLRTIDQLIAEFEHASNHRLTECLGEKRRAAISLLRVAGGELQGMRDRAAAKDNPGLLQHLRAIAAAHRAAHGLCLEGTQCLALTQEVELTAPPEAERSTRIEPQVAIRAKPPSAHAEVETSKRVREEAPAVAQPQEVKKTAEYERILDAFTVDQDVVILLDPPTLERFSVRPKLASAGEQLNVVASRFRELHLVALEAAAALNLGAISYFDGRADEGYAAVMRAQALFGRIGDARGIAASHEWLGYFFEHSDAPGLAAKHLAVAHELYGIAGLTQAAERVVDLPSRR